MVHAVHIYKIVIYQKIRTFTAVVVAVISNTTTSVNSTDSIYTTNHMIAIPFHLLTLIFTNTVFTAVNIFSLTNGANTISMNTSAANITTATNVADVANVTNATNVINGVVAIGPPTVRYVTKITVAKRKILNFATIIRY